MIARIFFVVCCVVLVFSRFGRSELKDPIIPKPPTYQQNYPPVIEASYKAELPKLRALLDEGDLNPNIRSFTNATALEITTRDGDNVNAIAAVRELLKYGARARTTDNYGMAPIHQVPAVALHNNRNDLIYMLFVHGADFRVYSNKQVAGFNMDFNKYVEDRKFDKPTTAVKLKEVPRQGYTLLDMTVCNYDRTGVIDLLKNWGGLIPREEYKRSRDYAYELGFRDIADAIDRYAESKSLEWIANLQSRGLNDIMIGALTNNSELVSSYAKAPADGGPKINSFSNDTFHRPPLQLAIIGHNPDMVEFLLQHGADVKAKDYRGNTALHQVAWLGDIILQKKLTPLLLQHKASLRATNDRRENILHYAIRLGDLPYIQYLLSTFKPEELGLDDKTSKGLTPYYLAEKVDFKEAMKIVPKR
jgi:ankyrin repeat protein